jgi:hypothetical protein
MFQVSQDIEDESLSKSVEEDEYRGNLRKCYVMDKNVTEYADEDGSSTEAGSNKAQ